MTSRYPVTCCLLLALAPALGCHKPEAAHDDHLEHHVPEHKPPDLRVAIDQIERRFEALAHDEVPPATRAGRLKELVEIVRWLPEIAGDSDLPEGPWNLVDQESRQLGPLLQQALTRLESGQKTNLKSLHGSVDAAVSRLRQAADELPAAATARHLPHEHREPLETKDD